MPSHSSPEYQRAWRRANPAKVREYEIKYAANKAMGRRERDKRNAAKLAAQKIAWRLANAERVAQKKAQWRKANASRILAENARRKELRLQATPRWANPARIASFYKEARRLSESTGRKHHVDHNVPLISPIVCGLHVETNLRVVSAAVNLGKNNLTWPDMPERR